MKLLLLEDNSVQADQLIALLRAQDYSVDCASDGETADALLRLHRYDLVLLGRRSPRMSGKNVLSRLRDRGDNVAVMMLTADTSIDDKLDCFESGADDCLVEPFDMRELLVRVKALLRRQGATRVECLNCGDLFYRSDTRQFRHNDTLLTMRRREHAILEALMLRQGSTVTKHTLLESCFGLDDPPSRDAIDLYIHRLRRHLEHSSAQILTLRGLGYLLRENNAALPGVIGNDTQQPAFDHAYERDSPLSSAISRRANVYRQG